MAKERMQNPAVGDEINLRLFTYNQNNLAALSSIEKVSIYYLDRALITVENPDGRRLVAEFDEDDVDIEDVGTHLLQVTLEENVYVIGRYLDVWTVNVSDDQPSEHIEQVFDIYPKLWYSTPTPVVYDFQFRFQPNKLRKGSKQYIIAEIIPNVPTAGDLRKYYENLAIVSDLKISIALACGECVPEEEDLRLIVDSEAVDYREKRFGFYKLDTTEMDCGIYHIWFQLDFGGNTYLSDKMPFQIFD